MGRFARDTSVLPGSLERAADQLQASVERHVCELLSAAETRASEISDQTARKAFDLQAGAATGDGAARMLEAIDLLENRMTESFASLRAEAETLLRTLEQARPGARNGEYPADDDWIEELDDAMADLLAFDELPD